MKILKPNINSSARCLNFIVRASGAMLFSLLLVNSASAAFTTNTIRFVDDFESYTNQTPLIDGTNGWYGSSLDVMVQTNFFYAGIQAAQIPIDSTLSNRFDPDLTIGSNVWVEMYIRPVLYDGTNNPVVDPGSAIVSYVNSNGYFVVRNSTEWDDLTNAVSGNPVPEITGTNWVQVDFWINYANNKYSFFLDGELLKEEIGFADPGVDRLSSIDIYNGGFATSYIDNVEVSFNVPEGMTTNQPYGAPDMTVATLSFSTNIMAGYHPANTNTFNVERVGGSYDLFFTTTISNANWLTASPASDSIANPGESVPVDMTFNANVAGLSVGVYTGYVIVNGYDNQYYMSVSNSPQIVEFELTVNPRPELSASKTNITVETREDVNPSPESLVILNASDFYTLDWTSVVVTVESAIDWLSVTPVSGSSTGTNDPTEMVVNFHTTLESSGPTNMSRGSYTGIVTLTGTAAETGMAADNSPIDVEVVLNITYPPPKLEASPTEFQLRIPRGGTDSRTLSVRNSKFYTLIWEAVASEPWLTLSQTSGTNQTTATTINMAFNVADMDIGTYTSTINITGIDERYREPAENSPLNIPVEVVIYEPDGLLWLNATDGTYSNMVKVQWSPAEGAVTYEVWRGATSNLSAAELVGTTADTSFNDTDTDPGKLYYYRARGVNAYGYQGGYSPADTGFRRLLPPTTIAAGINEYDNRIRVTWTAAPGSPAGYEVWRTISGGASELIGSSTSLAYDDYNAAPSMRYYYWVKATNALGKSSAGPFAEGIRRLTVPEAVSASEGMHANRVILHWNAVAGAQSYDIWRDGARIATSGSAGYTDTNAAFGVGYNYRVRATSSLSTGNYSGTVTGWTAPATTPVLHASSGTYTHKIGMHWDAVEEAIQYEILRSETDDFRSYVSLGTTSGTTFDDLSATPGNEFYYRARILRDGLSWMSRMDSGWRRPAPPAWLNASQSTYPGGIRVKWGEAEGAELYEIWANSENNSFGARKLADIVGTTEETYIDSTVAPGATRYYWIRTRGEIGVSDYSFVAIGRAPLTLNLGGTDWVPVPGDYDGDGLTDPAVYRAADGAWRGALSSLNYAERRVSNWGGPGWLPSQGDYDGDGRTDPAVYDEATGSWRVWLSGSGYIPLMIVGWGGPGQQPVPGDYDGDGLADPAVYDNLDGKWRIWRSGSGYAANIMTDKGGPGWTPVPGDYDGDGRTDPAVYDEATGSWRVWLSGSGYAMAEASAWGGPSWIPVAADYDGDGLADPAVYRESDGIWHIWRSYKGYSRQTINFGGSGWQTAPGDYHGTGRFDLGIYQQSTGLWWVKE